MAFGGFKNIVINIVAKLNKQSTQAATQQMQQALNQGTNPTGAQQNLGAVNLSLGNLIKTARQLGTTLAIALGGRAIFRFVADSIMQFAKFDQKLQQSVAIMEGVNATIRKEMSATAIAVSKELNLAADELAGAYYYLASAGLDAKQSLAGLPIVALFAKAGMMELNEATELLTQSNAVLGYQSKDAQKNLAGMVRVADVLTKASMESQATIDQLAVSLATKAGNSLKLFNKDIEEGAAVLSVFANQGIRGAVAGERLDMFMRQATQAAIKNKDAFKKYGIEIFDSEGKMRNMADIADDLTKALGHLNDEGQVIALTQLGFQVRTVAAAKAFIGQGQAIRDYETSLRSASGYTKQVADEMLKTPIEKWGIFKQKIVDARMELGEKFVDALTESGEVLGDENDPNSIVGMLRLMAVWLGNNQGMIMNLAKAVVFIATKPLMWFFNIMNDLADALIMVSGTGMLLLVGGFNVLAIAVLTVLGPLGLFLDWISGGVVHHVKDFANEIMALSQKVNQFGKDVAQTMKNSAKTFFGGENWRHNLPQKGGGPKKTDGLSSAGSGRDGKPGTDDAFGDLDPEGRAKRIADLSDRLNRILAQHTKQRADNQLAQLEDLEKDYQRIYGDKIPAIVRAAFASIRESIAREGEADAFREQFETFKDIGASQEYVDDFITRMTNLRDTLDESSVAWVKYNDLIMDAIKLSKKMKTEGLGNQLEALRKDFEHFGVTGENIGGVKAFIKSIEDQMAAMDRNSVEWREYNELLMKAKELQQDIIDKIEDIKQKTGQAAADAAIDQFNELLGHVEDVANTVEGHLTDAWVNFFTVLGEGSRKGNDAIEMLGRGILAAMMGGIGEYGMKRARMAWAEAAEQVAHGIKNLTNPLTAPAAAGNFAAAAKFTAVGTLWAALGAGGGMAANSITSYGAHGMPREAGRDKVSRAGPEIHIHIDGVDPSNPVHQQLIGETVAEYQELTGGALITHKGTKR